MIYHSRIRKRIHAIRSGLDGSVFQKCEQLFEIYKEENEIAVDSKGLEWWKKMSKEERQAYIMKAEKVNSAHTKALLGEGNDMSWVDDETDSAEVGSMTSMNMENALSFRSSSTATLHLHPLSPASFTPQFPTQLRLSRVKRSNSVGQHRNRALVISNACGSHENGFQIIPTKIFMEEAIGAEYGEGFETFRPDGPLKIDVDFLNDMLQEGFLKRIRYAMKPDEAYGLIFSWDNVVADARALKLNAWKQLATEEGKEFPEDDETQRLMLYAGAEHVLHKVLQWEKAENDLDRLKLRLSLLYYDNLLELSKPVEGLKDWLDAVSTARIPCAVVSSLDRRSMIEALERMGLMKYFQAVVTEEDGMESIAHRFLSAAVKLDRKPSKCVVFEDDPRGITAAHNCTMMAIALIGAHPAYKLQQADLAVASFNELSVINLRRLFAHKGSSFMDMQKQIIEKSPPRRKLTIDTIL